MKAEGKRADRAGRRVGAVMFTVGLTGLVVVFGLAAAAFGRVPAALGGTQGSSGSGIGGVLGATAARAAFLLVMAYVSSLVASKGLELYQAAGEGGGARGEGEEPVQDPEGPSGSEG